MSDGIDNKSTADPKPKAHPTGSDPAFVEMKPPATETVKLKPGASDPGTYDWFLDRLRRTPEALGIVDSIRERVIQDIEQNDCFRLTAKLAETTYARMAAEKRIELMVKNEFETSLGKIRNTIALVGLLITVVGVGSIWTVMNAQASTAAEKAVTNQRKQMNDDASSLMTKITDAADRAKSSVADARVSIEGTTAKAKADIDAAVEAAKLKVHSVADEATAKIGLESTQATLKIQSGSVSRVEEFENTLLRKQSEMTEKIAKESGERLAETTKSIAALVDDTRKITEAAKTDVQRIADEAVKHVKKDMGKPLPPIVQESSAGKQNEGNPPDAESPELEQGTPQFELMIRYVKVRKARDFGALLEIINDPNAPKASEIADLAARQILTGAPKFKPADVAIAIDSIGRNRDAKAKFSGLTEAVFGSLRSGDKDTFAKAKKAFLDDPMYEITENAFEDFAIAVGDQKPPEVLQAALAKVKLTRLTTRGLANLLAVCKRAPASIRGSKGVTEVERLLLRSLRTDPPITEPSDYTLAFLVTEAVSQEPVDDVPAVRAVLRSMSKAIFVDEVSAVDPWGIRDLIGEFDKAHPDTVPTSPP